MLIREQDKLKIIELASSSIKTPSELWAFGSRVNGDAHDMSDLDLVIVPLDDKRLDIDEFINFKDSLRESNIPIIVQVMDWNKIPKSFHDNIYRNYEVIYKKGDLNGDE